MRQYSHFFSTVYDEVAPVGPLGDGTHYTIGRVAHLNGDDPHFQDFAIIWDRDHDVRVIWIIESLIASRQFSEMLFVGEHKGTVTFVMRDPSSLKAGPLLQAVTVSVPNDVLKVRVEPWATKSSSIAPDDPERVRAYLGGINALWNLGSKPLSFSGPAPTSHLARHHLHQHTLDFEDEVRRYEERLLGRDSDLNSPVVLEKGETYDAALKRAARRPEIQRFIRGKKP